MSGSKPILGGITVLPAKNPRALFSILSDKPYLQLLELAQSGGLLISAIILFAIANVTINIIIPRKYLKTNVKNPSFFGIIIDYVEFKLFARYKKIQNFDILTLRISASRLNYENSL